MENQEDRSENKPRVAWSISLNLTSIIWLLVGLVILATAGKYLIAINQPEPQKPASAVVRSKPVKAQIPWAQVDKDLRTALESAHADAESDASVKLKKWTDELMVRVDKDFLPWYFGYWQQQMLGIKAVWWWGWDKLWNEKPTMMENITENVQSEFASRVLRPEIAQMQIERIAHETVDVYIRGVQKQVADIQLRYDVPKEEWERYLESISHTVEGVEGGTSIPLTLKAIVAGSVGSGAVVASSMKPLIAKIGTKLGAKTAGKAAGKLAAKTGAKVAAKAGGKMLGPLIGIGILIWDVWDHHTTKSANMPILRKNLEDFLVEMRTDLLKDPETGIMAVIDHLEGELVTTLKEEDSKDSPAKE